jgi:hypothetical protein
MQVLESQKIIKNRRAKLHAVKKKTASKLDVSTMSLMNPASDLSERIDVFYNDEMVSTDKTTGPFPTLERFAKVRQKTN